MKSALVIVNGKARSGKNTVVDFSRYVLHKDFAISTEERSSIEIVRKLLESIGIDTEVKTDDVRRVIANVGNELEDFRSTRTLDILEHYFEFHDSLPFGESGVFFTYTREPKIIDKMKEMVTKMAGSRDMMVTTLFISNNNVENIVTNDIDKNVEQDYYYDFRLDNSDDRGTLFSNCEEFSHVLKGMLDGS